MITFLTYISLILLIVATGLLIYTQIKTIRNKQNNVNITVNVDANNKEQLQEVLKGLGDKFRNLGNKY